jgi:hypothetical protein
MAVKPGSYPTNPPHFREAPEFSFQRCETFEDYSAIGYCARYQLPVLERELCDSFVSIMEKGKRQWSET